MTLPDRATIAEALQRLNRRLAWCGEWGENHTSPITWVRKLRIVARRDDSQRVWLMAYGRWPEAYVPHQSVDFQVKALAIRHMPYAICARAGGVGLRARAPAE